MECSSNIGFLQSEFPQSSPESALFHIISAPLERSVSFGEGTCAGPQAIIAASQELEAFDGISVPGEIGICSMSAIDCDAGDTKDIVGMIADSMRTSFGMKKIPILLGGEHTVSVGAFQALGDSFDEVGIIQFDAHADLRKAYQDNIYSHASVMHRALDMDIPFFQVGVRSLSSEEHILRNERSIPHVDAHQLHHEGVSAFKLPATFPKKVYITFDVDAMDPSVMPSTGTPEPGGLLWYDIMSMFQTISENHEIIGFDCVELAPIEKLHAPDFAIARLIYNLMGFISRSKSPCTDTD